MPIVNGTISKPNDDAPEDEKLVWEKRDNLAKQLIGLSVTFQVLRIWLIVKLQLLYGLRYIHITNRNRKKIFIQFRIVSSGIR